MKKLLLAIMLTGGSLCSVASAGERATFVRQNSVRRMENAVLNRISAREQVMVKSNVVTPLPEETQILLDRIIESSKTNDSLQVVKTNGQRRVYEITEPQLAHSMPERTEEVVEAIFNSLQP